jgi:hypothetical protein
MTKEERAAYMREYRRNNPDNEAEYKRKYREKNKKEIAEYQRNYYLCHRGLLVACGFGS